MTKAQEKEREEAKEYLHTIIKPGDTVYTILRHVSRSGMMRIIDPVIMTPDAGLYSIAGWAAKALGEPLDRDRWGVKIGGCGMDMGFHLVHNLSYTLFPEGFNCIGEGCPSNDHHNDYLTPDHDHTLDYSPNRHHKYGGYALRHKWL